MTISIESNVRILQLIEESAQPLYSNDYEPILTAIDDAQIVMIGEASHGSDEFYSHRAELTKQLIEKKGFTIIACEADWPPAYRVNRWVKEVHSSTIEDAADALKDFIRFPSWLWRNTVVLDFITWLRNYNMNQFDERKKKVGFFGIDIYSLQSSREEVLNYLEENVPDLARMARRNYRCFERYTDEHEYGICAGTNLNSSCEKEALRVLKKMLERHAQLISEEKNNEIELDECFYAMENAKIVREAEKYYRHMFQGGQSTWNIRDTHMCDCLQDLIQHHGHGTKAIVWAHNSHVGDARATEFNQIQKINIGQLIRERFGLENTFNIGFTTFNGTVTAADSWNMDANVKQIRPALPTSIESLFHQARLKTDQYFLLFRSNNPSIEISKELYDQLNEHLLERAIGAIYRPQTERQSHYFHAKISSQFDCVIHVDKTNALRPLEIHPDTCRIEKMNLTNVVGK